jgi:hypothetical protein
MELHSRLVDYPACKTIERIDLADDRALANSTEAWVTGTCSEVFDLRCDKSRSRAAPGCRSACLCARMSAADYNDIERSGLRLVSKSRRGVVKRGRGAYVTYLVPSDTVASCRRSSIHAPWGLYVNLVRFSARILNDHALCCEVDETRCV